MSEKPIALSKAIQWRLECLAYAVVERMVACLPGSWVFHLGEFFGGLAWHLMPKRRKIIERNLRIAYAGEKDLAEIQKLAKATMRRAGANLISAAHTASLLPERLCKVLRVENMELMEEALNKGRGVVLLLAHMGNWELLSRLTHFLPEGTQLGGFYRPLNNKFMDDRVLARREADGSRMFSKRDPFHQVTGFLRSGGVVGVLADQRVGYSGDLVDFFGKRSLVSPLPSLLARRAKSEMLSLSLKTERAGAWTARFTAVQPPLNTKHAMQALESSMKEAPEDVFWLHHRWRALMASKHTLKDLLGDDEAPSEKPHRALLWLVGMNGSWVMPDEWVHQNLIYEVAVSDERDCPEWLPEQTKLHRVESGLATADYFRTLNDIDQTDPLPLDFLLTSPDADEVMDACKEMNLPAYATQ